tara:strand:- start:440 stop:652 length:213 start_codon:yes stop_codon:yes gene_type:complete
MSAEKIVATEQNPISFKTPKLNANEFSGRVDINKLIARVRKEKDEENRTNLVIFSIFAALILIVGVILSL